MRWACNCFLDKYLQILLSLPVLQVLIFSHLKNLCWKNIKTINQKWLFSLGFAVNKRWPSVNRLILLVPLDFQKRWLYAVLQHTLLMSIFNLHLSGYHVPSLPLLSPSPLSLLFLFSLPCFITFLEVCRE